MELAVHHPEDLWRLAGHCPHPVPIIGRWHVRPTSRRDQTKPACYPAALWVGCRKRQTCDPCYRHWLLDTYTRFQHHIEHHDGPLYAWAIEPDLWLSAARFCRRANDLFEYVTLRQDNGLLAILSTGAVPGYQPLRDNVLALAELRWNLVGADRHGGRVLHASNGWGPLDDAKKQRWFEAIGSDGKVTVRRFRREVKKRGYPGHVRRLGPDGDGPMYAWAPLNLLDRYGQMSMVSKMNEDTFWAFVKGNGDDK